MTSPEVLHWDVQQCCTSCVRYDSTLQLPLLAVASATAAAVAVAVAARAVVPLLSAHNVTAHRNPHKHHLC
jgi:hypothetical protein